MSEMSTVRISNGSPALERVDTVPTDHKQPVCRKLFLPDNRKDEELNREFDEKMQDAKRVFVERWNYDINNDRPLSPGNCEWIAVSSSEVPAFYSRAPHRRRYSTGEDGNVKAKTCQLSRPVTGTFTSTDTEKRVEQTGCSNSNSASRRRFGCTEECQNAKRPCFSQEPDSEMPAGRIGEEHDESASHTAERTPIKPDSST